MLWAGSGVIFLLDGSSNFFQMVHLQLHQGLSKYHPLSAAVGKPCFVEEFRPLFSTFAPTLKNQPQDPRGLGGKEALNLNQTLRSCLLDHTPDANWGNWAYRILVNVDRIARKYPRWMK